MMDVLPEDEESGVESDHTDMNLVWSCFLCAGWGGDRSLSWLIVVLGADAVLLRPPSGLRSRGWCRLSQLAMDLRI